MPCPKLMVRAAVVLLTCAVLSCSGERVMDASNDVRIHPGDRLFCGKEKGTDCYAEPGQQPLFRVPWGTMATAEEVTRKGKIRSGFVRCTVQHNGSPVRVWLYSIDVYVADKDGRVDALTCGQFERRLAAGDEIYAGRFMPNVPSNPLLREPHPRALRSAKINVPSDTELVIEEVVNGFVKVTYRDSKGAHVGWLTAKHVALTRFYWFYQGTFIFLMIALLIGFNFFIVPGLLGGLCNSVTKSVGTGLGATKEFAFETAARLAEGTRRGVEIFFKR
ncbi:MAG: hypothetical protein ISS72_11405 [Candidatus Brocadiae bacterium]|nr:hypothetical protein [Candidatus Brocadiia bacterium]